MTNAHYTVLCLLLVLRGSETRKRSYYFRQQNAKTHDKTIDCCLKLIAENSEKADFNHTAGQCDTTATMGSTITGLIRFVRMETMFDESYIVDTGDLPAILGFRDESRDPHKAAIFHVTLTTPQDNDWLRFDFVDGVYTRFTIRMLYDSNKTYLQKRDYNSDWINATQYYYSSDPAEIVSVEITYYLNGVQVYLSNGQFDPIDNSYEPFESIRYNSTFATCSHISFT